MNNHDKIYIILVNFNGWRDTIECLESILHNNYSNYQVIVCDNASTDGSLERIKEWAEGKYVLNIDETNPLKHLTKPYFKKPVSYTFYRFEDLNNYNTNKLLSDNQLILIDTGCNRGFAWGNNAGIKFALIRNDYSYVWILNNDTVIEKDSLLQLLYHSNKNKINGQKIGITGSKLLYYDKPGIIQAVGGIYYRTLAYSRHIGTGEPDNGQFDRGDFKKDYVIGASLFVSKEYIDDVGLMCEDYFIYFEETDWITRGNKKGWEVGFNGMSKIYHKEGASTGSNKQKNTKSGFTVFHFFRSTLIFTKKHYPFLLITVIPRISATILYRFLRGDITKTKAMITALFGKNNILIKTLH